VLRGLEEDGNDDQQTSVMQMLAVVVLAVS
jgi:hypothetical protein